MAIRFILGRAGSGKSTACLRAMAELSKLEPLGPPLIFLVPEQATFQMERELATLCGGGTFRAQVLSFQRLAYRLLQDGRKPLALISEQGKQMLLRRLLQEHSSEMNVLGKAAKQPRFCLQLSAQLRELSNYKVTPESLRRRADSTKHSTVLQGKLLDLAEIAGAYEAYTYGRFTDHEKMLQLLAATIETGGLPAGTRVWVDGFAGFTLQEYAVLGALSKAASQLELALCLDASFTVAEPAEDELFHPTLDSRRRLQQLASQAGITILPPLILPSQGQKTRYAQCPPLAHLEAQFNCFPLEPYPQATAKIKLVTAAGTRAEVEAMARDIYRIVRENGWRYADIGVILRDFSAYHDLVASVFREYNIPYYLDARHFAAHHPLVEFLRSALEAALSNLSATPVIQLLKTDLFPLERLEVDRLENYVRVHGVRGRRWLDKKPWTFRLCLALDDEHDERFEKEVDLAALNKAKEQFAHYFEPFYKAVAEPGIQEVTVYCQAVWELLETTAAQSRLQAWAKTQTADGQINLAAQHRQVWQGVVELLSQAASIWAGQTMSLQEFTQLIFTGLESLTLGLTPAGLDQIIVGSVERSRLPQIKAAYVLGLSEGDFPARLQEEGIFGDEERDLLATAGMEMAATRRQKLFHEQYLSYIALTRSSDYLWASYPLADEEGRGKRPSILFKRLQQIFPENETYFMLNLPDSADDLTLLTEPQKTAAIILLQANRSINHGQMSTFWATVYNESLQQPQIIAAMERLWRALSETNIVAALAPPILAALYGNPLKSSVSRLELFARCPFAHFARHALLLEERTEYRLEAPDVGIFYHIALSQFVGGIIKDQKAWPTLGDAEVKERMKQIVEKLAPRLRSEILMSTSRMRYLAEKLKDSLGQAAVALTEHARSSTLLPVALELSFGRNRLLPWRLTAGATELWLYGQIDRVDLAESAGRAYLSVIDYKTNPQDLKLSDVWEGLALQLLVYQAVLLEQAAQFTKLPVTVAGVFYFGIQQSMERVPNPPPPNQSRKDAGLLDGLALADAKVLELLGGTDFLRRAKLKNDGTFTKTSRVADAMQMSELLTWLRGKLLELAGKILAGDAAARPYRKQNGQRACSFCPYLAFCRFDLTVAGSSYRQLESMGHEDVLSLMMQQQERRDLL
ncbi:MAG: helicase-exonuclease AddAB subunit AddB [Dethiobacter sp.]|nr:helicase-exonuclease AddAB subunit AddB [Dethiobacter sp.]MCL4464114.1 helicase-exonuclease AddAB subunit AddB [Bacillota bacterium]MCL5993760.1 helicase-exonuclease AddAB subunit AddB [Bacillota bacterium]